MYDEEINVNTAITSLKLAPTVSTTFMSNGTVEVYGVKAGSGSGSGGGMSVSYDAENEALVFA